MIPWMPISDRKSTSFYKQEMQFYFARVAPRKLSRFQIKSSTSTLVRNKEHMLSRVQNDIMIFKKRLEGARKARSKYTTF
jgi:hypothetical protein